MSHPRFPLPDPGPPGADRPRPGHAGRHLRLRRRLGRPAAPDPATHHRHLRGQRRQLPRLPQEPREGPLRQRPLRQQRRGRRAVRAEVFAPGEVPVVGRLAIGGSNPYAPDASVPVRSLALQLRTASGQEWRTGMNTPPVLPVSGIEGFFEQVLASKPDPATGKPDPARLQASSPPTRKAPPSASGPRTTGPPTASPMPPTTASTPSAWWTATAMVATCAGPWSRRRPTSRWPARRTTRTSSPTTCSSGCRPLRWHLVLTLAEAGDPSDDPSRPWPASRQRIDAGTLVIDRAQAEDQAPAATSTSTH